MTPDPAPLAVVGGRLLTGLVDVTTDLAALEGRGLWAVVLPFDGAPVLARFAEARPARPWPGRLVSRAAGRSHILVADPLGPGFRVRAHRPCGGQPR